MYTRTPCMTSFFVLGGSSPFGVLVAGDVDEVEVVGCILSKGLELDAEVIEDAGPSCWFLSFSRRRFKYDALSILDSDL